MRPPGGGVPGLSGTEGAAPVFRGRRGLFKTSACPRFVKEGDFYHPGVGGGGGGVGGWLSGTEGERTRVTYFAEEGVFICTPGYEVWECKYPYNPRL